MCIIGIGASAGGLDVLDGFFTHVQTRCNAGFGVIRDIVPSRKGMMAELLSHSKKMKVTKADNGMKVMPNCTGVILPNPTKQNMIDSVVMISAGISEAKLLESELPMVRFAK
jgi:chemotaxis response regulator CheB